MDVKVGPSTGHDGGVDVKVGPCTGHDGGVDVKGLEPMTSRV